MYSEKVYNKFIDVKLYFCTELLKVLTCLTLHECNACMLTVHRKQKACKCSHFITHSNLVEEKQ